MSRSVLRATLVYCDGNLFWLHGRDYYDTSKRTLWSREKRAEVLGMGLTNRDMTGTIHKLLQINLIRRGTWYDPGATDLVQVFGPNANMEQDEPVCSVPTDSTIAVRIEGDNLVTYCVDEEGAHRIIHRRGIPAPMISTADIPLTKDATIPGLFATQNKRIWWKAWALTQGSDKVPIV